MKKTNLLPIMLIIGNCILTLLSLILLPDKVITQISVGSTGKTIMPKEIAVLIPLIIGAGGAISCFFNKENKGAQKKGMLVSLVGIALFLVMILVNCVAK